MKTRFFRAGVATVVYNGDGKVAFFRRATHPVGAWQFQQGGIDRGEFPEQTLWRELKEEVGLEEGDIELVTEMPGWHHYESSDVAAGVYDDRIGQIHKWYFLKLKDDHVIDLHCACQVECDGVKWITFGEATKLAGLHKRPVYEELYSFFRKHLVDE